MQVAQSIATHWPNLLRGGGPMISVSLALTIRYLHRDAPSGPG